MRRAQDLTQAERKELKEKELEVQRLQQELAKKQPKKRRRPKAKAKAKVEAKAEDAGEAVVTPADPDTKVLEADLNKAKERRQEAAKQLEVKLTEVKRDEKFQAEVAKQEERATSKFNEDFVEKKKLANGD